MQNPGLIDDYVDRLARKLDFDRSLSRCVRQEVEDHLREAVAADVTSDAVVAERRAVANFGDPDAIAAQFAVISLAKQSRRASATSILGIAAIFIAMKGRVAWYAAGGGTTTSHDLRSIVGIVGSIDRYAFWFSVVAGIGCWLYIGSRGFPHAFDSVFRKQLDRFLLLSMAMIAALTASVISDGVLTAIGLSAAGFSASSLVPIFSMAVEISCVGLVALLIRGTTRRVAQIAAWWNT